MKEINRQPSTNFRQRLILIVTVMTVAGLLTVTGYTASSRTDRASVTNNGQAQRYFGGALNFLDHDSGRSLEKELFVQKGESNGLLQHATSARTIRSLKPTELRLTKAHSWDGDLRNLPYVRPVKKERPEREGPEPQPRPYPNENLPAPSQVSAPAPDVITPAAPAPTPITTFDGLDFANWGDGHPPDTNGDVGPTYYIQTVNTSIGIYNKGTGARVAAFTYNTFMSQGNFGNVCDTDNFGDPVVVYDSFEDRWIISDFAFQLDASGNVSPQVALQCFAASKTNDPVSGGWNFYSINTTGGLGDYPKLGIWPDGLYMSANMFDYAAAGSFQNVRVYAFNKLQMYAGAATVQSVSFDLPSDQFTVLPANARLQTGTPPAGSPNYMASVWNFLNAIEIWKFHVDWNNISLSSVTGPFDSTMTFWWEQWSGTTAPTPANGLDTLYPRLMVQNQYSNISGVESLWDSHSVGAGNPTSNLTSAQSAIRYYQVNVTGGTVAANTVQSFTYSPDATIHRYMPSVAVDRGGNMAIGYTTSNSTTNPGIKYAGRLSGDAANSITQTEQTLFQGTGSQSGNCGKTIPPSPCTRWGDYSAMTLDPDGCTFWYTNEYYATNDLNDLTRIGSFKYPSCTAVGAGGTISGIVTDSANSNPISGATITFGARTTTTNGSGAYSFTGIPAGTYPSITASFAGYGSSTTNTIVVTDGGTNIKNFSLTAAANNGCPVDTTQSDFQLGVPTNTDLTATAGSVLLSKPVVLNQSNTTLSQNGFGITSTTWFAQGFTPSVSGSLVKADINLFCSGCTGTTPNLTLSVRATSSGLPTGADLASGTITGFSSGSAGYFSVTFASPPTLTSGTVYALVIRPVSNPSVGTYAITSAGSSVYAGGRMSDSGNSGASWSNVNPTNDAGFHTYMTTGYSTSGDFVSSLKDGNPAGVLATEWDTLSWSNAALPAGTSLKFQAAGSNSSTGPFNFVGPDGTAATFFTTSGASLAQFNGFRYLKYKAILATTNSANTPTLNDVTVCFNSNNLIFNSNGSVPTGTFRDITVNSPAVVTGGNATVTGCVNVNNGATLNMGTSVLSGAGCFKLNAGGTLGIGDANGITSGTTASGNVQVTGGRTYSTGGNYTYNGSSAQVTGNGMPATVNNLTSANSAGTSLTQDVTVGGVLTLTNNLDAGSFTVTEAGTSAGTADVIGNVKRTDLGASAKAFGNPFNTIAVTAGAVPANIVVNLVNGSPGDFANAVRRTYTITPSASGFTGTLQLHYNDSELNGNSEATLDLWRNNGSAWSDVGAATRDTSNNFVQQTGITQFSPWTLSSSGNAPTAVRLTKFNASSYADGVQVNWESGFEVNNLGYHLYREQGGKRTRVTPGVVAGSALSVGQGNRLNAGYSYVWFDKDGTADSAYWLEAIDLNGGRVWTGPLYPATPSINAASPRQERAALLSDVAATATANSEASRSLSKVGLSGWPALFGPDNWNLTSLGAKQTAMTMQQSIASGAAVKIAVNGSGWYRISRDELAATGFDLSGDARLLQLYADGQQVPIRLTTDGARLSPGDTIEFFATGLDLTTTGTHVYYLIKGASNGLRITTRREKVRQWQVLNESPGTRSFDFTTERREKMLYASHLLNGDDDNIFGAPIFSEPHDESMTVRSFDGDSSSQPVLEVSLLGLTEQEHDVSVQFNNVTLGTITFNGVEHPSMKFPLSRSMVHDGDNTITLTSTNGDSDISFVDSLRLTYAHRYMADDNALSFTVRAGDTVSVDGFSSPNVRVIDVTNPTAPIEVISTATEVATGYSVKVQGNSSGTRTFVAFADDKAAHPVSVSANEPSNWHSSSNAADLVIITHSDFRQAIEPLAALRRDEGMNVVVVDVDDVFDEFSYGAHTPAALKAFMTRAEASWTRKPGYLLLVGDSSWDPRNYLAQGENDFVPTKLIDTSYMETSSDDWIVDFTNSGQPNLAVGRLPARNTTELNSMIGKIMSYQHERELQAPLRGAVLVADNGFESSSSQTQSLLPTGLPVESINRSQVGSDDLMRSDILNALNEGPMVVNYFGHGSVRVWTGAGILDADLAGMLANTNKPSLFVLMTCLNGYASDAYVDSLGEAALKSPNGAFAVWASSGFTDAQPQFTMSQEFYRILFGNPSVMLGDAARLAKAGTSNQDVRRTWVFLGDPTMRLR